MTRFLWVALGSALGGMARYGLTLVMAEFAGVAFPWGTLLVNILGCAFIGWFAAAFGVDAKFPLDPTMRIFVMTGICGGFTTFSSFSLETLTLAREGENFKAAAYVMASVIICLLGVWLGHALGASWRQRV